MCLEKMKLPPVLTVEAAWDAAETSPHVTESEGEEEMSRGKMCKVSD